MNAKTATGGREIALVSDLHLRSADEAADRQARGRALELAQGQIDNLCRGNFEQGMRELNCS